MRDMSLLGKTISKLLPMDLIETLGMEQCFGKVSEIMSVKIYGIQIIRIIRYSFLVF